MNTITIDEAYETRCEVMLKWQNPCVICRPFRINELDREDFIEQMDGSISFRGFEVNAYDGLVTITFDDSILILDQGINAVAPKWCFEPEPEKPKAYELVGFSIPVEGDKD